LNPLLQTHCTYSHAGKIELYQYIGYKFINPLLSYIRRVINVKMGRCNEKVTHRDRIPIPLNNCPLRIHPAGFGQGVGVQ